MTIPEVLKDLINATFNPSQIVGTHALLQFKLADIPQFFQVNFREQHCSFQGKTYYYDNPTFPDNLMQHLLTTANNWRITDRLHKAAQQWANWKPNK